MQTSKDVKLLFTSNFRLSGTDPKAVSIALSSPHWYNGDHFDALKPTWELIDGLKNGTMTETEYRALYMDLIRSRIFSRRKVVNKLVGRVLLCWEAPNEFCHRHIVADWFNTLPNVKCAEVVQCK